MMKLAGQRCFSCTALLILLAGCGNTDRQAMRGSVMLDDKPLPSGAIRFIPMPGTSGPSAGSEIKNGEFMIKPNKGVLAGSFRVEITASRKTGRKSKDRISGEMTDIYAQFLPARYNRSSKLTAVVKAGGPNQFEFILNLK